MSVIKSIITDKKYGKIEVTRNPRARHIIARVKKDCISVTIPLQASERDIQKMLAQYGEKLLEQKSRLSEKSIDFSFTIDSDNFSLRLSPYSGNKYFIKREDERRFTIICPNESHFTDIKTYEFIHKVIISVMRKRAKEVLPTRLDHLAKKYGFKYARVSIRESHTRWGSCSTKGNISLSIYLILLRNELIDYVLLHELCHTQEMNHGLRFWELLDSVTASRAKALRAELKRHKTSF